MSVTTGADADARRGLWRTGVSHACRRPGTASGALTAAATGACLVIILAVLLPMSAAPGRFWLAMLWLTWAATLIWALRRPAFSAVFTALTLSMFIFIIVPATGAQLYGGTVLGIHDYQAGVVPALKIAALAQAAMLAGGVSARTLRPARGFERIAVNLPPSRLGKIANTAAAASVAAVLCMSLIGGASLRAFFAFTTPGGYGSFWSQVHGNLGFLTAVRCAGGMAIVLLPLRLSGSRRRSRPAAVAVLASLVLLGGGQRGPFIAAATAAGLVWLKTGRNSGRQRRMVMAGALLLLLLTGLVGVARSAAANRQITLGSVTAEPFGPGNNLFLPLAGLSDTVPAEIPYLHGASYLQAFVLPVPRALWPAKPADDITVVITRFDPDNSGFAFPAFGEAYANFGLAGVALCGLLLGALAESLHRRLAASRDPGRCVLVAVEAAVFLQLFSRGDFAPMFTTYIGLLAVAAYIARRRPALPPGASVPVMPGDAIGGYPGQPTTRMIA